MKIVVLSPEFPPHGSGGEVATKAYVEALVKEGHDVTVVTNRYSTKEVGIEKYNYAIRRFRFYDGPPLIDSKLFISSIFFSKALYDIIRDADIIYETANNWFLVELIGKSLGKPIVRHLHSYAIICPLSSLFNNTSNTLCSGCGIMKGSKCTYVHAREKQFSFLKSSLFSTAGMTFNRIASAFSQRIPKRFIFVSETQRRLFERTAPDVARKGTVIHNPLPDLPLQTADQLGFAYLGGDVKEKGFYVLLRALSIYRPAQQFIMTKIQPQSIPALRHIGIKAYGKLDRSNLQEILTHVHCVVFPSLWEEPLPYAFFEGMLMGKLAIATRLGSLVEIMGERPGIIYVEPGSSQQLAEALRTASTMKLEEAYRLGYENRLALLKFYEARNPCEDLSDVLRSVQKTSAPRRSS